MRESKGRGMALFSVHVPWPYLEMVDALVERGYFASRGEAIRYALRLLLEKFEPLIRPIEGEKK